MQFELISPVSKTLLSIAAKYRGSVEGDSCNGRVRIGFRPMSWTPLKAPTPKTAPETAPVNTLADEIRIVTDEFSDIVEAAPNTEEGVVNALKKYLASEHRFSENVQHGVRAFILKRVAKYGFEGDVEAARTWLNKTALLIESMPKDQPAPVVEIVTTPTSQPKSHRMHLAVAFDSPEDALKAINGQHFMLRTRGGADEVLSSAKLTL
jgi:hypothetical protein